MIRTEYDVGAPLKPHLYRFFDDMINRSKKNCSISKGYYKNTELKTGKNSDKFLNNTNDFSVRQR